MKGPKIALRGDQQSLCLLVRLLVTMVLPVSVDSWQTWGCRRHCGLSPRPFPGHSARSLSLGAVLWQPSLLGPAHVILSRSVWFAIIYVTISETVFILFAFSFWPFVHSAAVTALPVFGARCGCVSLGYIWINVTHFIDLPGCPPERL